MSNLLLWLFIFIVSLAILIKAADFFTDAAEKIGLSLGLNQFIVGVTIVSLGTSLPELASSLFAVYQNSSEIVAGNVIGSNIANVLLIIGVTSILTKRIVIDYNLNDIDIPFLSVQHFVNSHLNKYRFFQGEAIICVMAYLVYFAYLVFESSDSDENFPEDSTSQNRRIKRSLWLPITILIVSSIGIFIGANYTINSVVKLAEIIDINTEVIAVSAVALGTSLPELVVSVTAAKKGNSGLVVGNIFGSNIFNALMVMGIPGLFGKLVIVPEVVSRDVPVMLVATILFFFATQDQQITRWEGFLFLCFTAGLLVTCLIGCNAHFTHFTTNLSMTYSSFNYPPSAKTDQVDHYHGIKVADPYRWLEEPNSQSTQAWIKAQNELTFNYLAKIPGREKIKQRLTQLWDYEKYGIPFKRGDRYFYSKNDGLQNQSILYALTSLDGEPRVLIDPNQLSDDGTISLSNYAVSDNGKLIAYGVSSSGSDWQEWKVRDVETGSDLDDRLQWVKFYGVSWTSDNQGFFYSRYDQPNDNNKFEDINYYQKLYYHRLGTTQSEDTLIYHRPDQKQWMFNGLVTEDGRYLIIYVSLGTDSRNLIFYQDLHNPNGEIVELISEFEASYRFVDNDGAIFWLKTDLDAPRSRLIAIDTNHPERENWQEIIPQQEDTLKGIGLLNNQFVANYLQDAHTVIKILNLDGTLVREVELPGIGSAGGFRGKRHDVETFYYFTSFNTPTTIYRYNMAIGNSTIFRQPEVDFQPDDFETEQVFYPSKDGTKISMFISYKKGLELDGNNPTYLYGYGGFNVSLTPSFSVSQVVWMEMGGIYAVANLRGGGEYGEEWHKAGMKLNKQNVFDDFISGAQWLIENKYTSHKKLAIAGGSNGGLLVGACMTQRPDLFAAALPAVGVMDMLRFPKFTIGWAWCAEYGNPEENEAEFQAVYQYSPLHNLKPGTVYPATLITTADHDDRVVPAHSFKFAAALQAAHNGNMPVLIRIETKTGHGAGKPTTKIIEEVADKWAFLVDNLGMESLS